MGILSEKRAATLGEHSIEVLAKNHVCAEWPHNDTI
jgi:hypothetical protein